MKRSSRQDIMKQMVSSGALSIDAARALTLCLDPFHDTNINPIGLPDMRTDPSVVQVVKRTVNIKAPSGIGSATWQCHVCTLPERSTWDVSNAGAGTDVVSEPCQTDPRGVSRFDNAWPGITHGGFPVSPIVIITSEDGASTFPEPSQVIPAHPGFADINYNDYFAGQSRVIASAFEVHNTTAVINKQGTVTVYRLPQSLEVESTAYLDSISGTTPVTGQFSQPTVTLKSRLPPATASEALLLPDSKQWEAEYGCYCVDTFDHDKNVPDTGVNANRLFELNDFPGGIFPENFSVYNEGLMVASQIGAFTTNNSTGFNYYATGCAPLCKPIHRNTSGAFFTGLSPTTTLTLTYHQIIETFPTQPNPLVTLARPTPDYDPLFFKLYKEAARLLPPGVMVSENADGGFWDTCLGILGDIAPVIGGLLPFPGAAQIGNLAGQAAKQGQQMLRKKKNSGDASKGFNLAKTAAKSASDLVAASMGKNENQFKGPANPQAGKQQRKQNKSQVSKKSINAMFRDKGWND